MVGACWRSLGARQLCTPRRRRPCVTKIARGTINLHHFFFDPTRSIQSRVATAARVWTVLYRSICGVINVRICGILGSSIFYRDNTSVYDRQPKNVTHTRVIADLWHRVHDRGLGCRREKIKDYGRATVLQFSIIDLLLCSGKWDLMILFAYCISYGWIRVTRVADGHVVRAYTLLCILLQYNNIIHRSCFFTECGSRWW